MTSQDQSLCIPKKANKNLDKSTLYEITKIEDFLTPSVTLKYILIFIRWLHIISQTYMPTPSSCVSLFMNVP